MPTNSSKGLQSKTFPLSGEKDALYAYQISQICSLNFSTGSFKALEGGHYVGILKKETPEQVHQMALQVPLFPMRQSSLPHGCLMATMML